MDEIKKQKSTTISGKEPTPGYEYASAPAPIDPNTGMHKYYWILNEEERAKGFIRPVRNAYIHSICRVETIMGQLLAETYARDPKYYGATFCVGCGSHFPVSEFLWSDTNKIVGS